MQPTVSYISSEKSVKSARKQVIANWLLLRLLICQSLFSDVSFSNIVMRVLYIPCYF